MKRTIQNLEKAIEEIEEEMEHKPAIISGVRIGVAYGYIADLQRMNVNVSDYKLRLTNLYRKYVGMPELKR